MGDIWILWVATFVIAVGGYWATHWRAFRWTARNNHFWPFTEWRKSDDGFFRRYSRNVRLYIAGCLISFAALTALGLPGGYLPLGLLTAVLFPFAVSAVFDRRPDAESNQ